MIFRKSIIRFEYFIKNLIIKWTKFLLFRNYSPQQAPKIVILRTGSIGDSICALPALNVIRLNNPYSEISLLTNPGAGNVSIEYLINPALGFKIINYMESSSWKLLKKMRTEKFDIFIELPQPFEPLSAQIRNMLFAKVIGAKVGLGWEIIATKTFGKFQEKNTPFISVRDSYLKMLTKSGMREYDVAYPLAISNDMKYKIKNLLHEFNLLDKKKNIAIIIGAKRSTNRWPIDFFRRVIQVANERDLKCLLIGSAQDKELATPLLDLSNVFDFCGQLSPLESCVVMSYCAITISNDTGPMHLSYAIGTPVIALFSARDYPYQWYPPLTKNNAVLRSFEEPCSPCFLEACPYDNACIKRISPESVIDKLDKMIAHANS